MWDWKGLSANTSLHWSEDLIDKYLEKWDWFWLSKNRALPWSRAFIERYIDFWDWRGLSQNECLPWGDLLPVNGGRPNASGGIFGSKPRSWFDSFFQKNINKWDCEALSMFDNIPKSEDFIASYLDYWDWKRLSSNKSLPWCDHLLVKFRDNWDTARLRISDIAKINVGTIIKNRRWFGEGAKHSTYPLTFVKYFTPLLNERIIGYVMMNIKKSP